MEKSWAGITSLQPSRGTSGRTDTEVKEIGALHRCIVHYMIIWQLSNYSPYIPSKEIEKILGGKKAETQTKTVQTGRES